MKYDETVFVFGSNMAGRHGAGAALFARKFWGAKYGEGIGRTGNAYALPTKDQWMKRLPVDEIEKHVAQFHNYTILHPSTLFLLTPIGCGLAKNDPKEIRDLMMRFEWEDNVALTHTWFDHFT